MNDSDLNDYSDLDSNSDNDSDLYTDLDDLDDSSDDSDLNTEDLINDIDLINTDPFDYSLPLWPHQDLCLKHINSKPLPCVVNMFCGSGKTRIIYEIIKSNQDKKIYLVVPTIDLLYQIYHKYLKAYITTNQLDAFICCSSAEKTRKITISTSQKELDKFIKNKTKFLIISTYASREMLKPDIDSIVIYDEAHHLSESEVKTKNIYYISATPREWMYDIENRFSFDCYDAIQAGIIQDYEIYVSLYDTSGITNIIDKQCKIYELLSECLEINTDNKNVDKVLCFNRYASKESDNKTSSVMVKDPTLKACIAKYLPGFKINYIIGEMTRKMRSNILHEFETTPKYILTNSKLISEGIDIRGINCILFMDSQKSPVRIVQALGRGLRKKPTAEPTIVFIPIGIQGPITQDNVDTAIDQNGFKDLINLLSGLKHVDKRIFNLLSGKTENIKVVKYLHANEIITTKINQKSSLRDWNIQYENLKTWIGTNNKLPSQSSKDISEKQLSQWKSDQIKAYKKQKLSEDRIKLLEQLSNWSWDINNTKWLENYENLKTWIHLNDKLPSSISPNIIEKKLGLWRQTQIIAYNKQKLTPDRISLLETLLHWTFNYQDYIWYKNYNDIKKFIELNDIYPNKRSSDLTEKLLGIWRQQQIQAHKNKVLSSDRINLLEQLKQWSWSPKSDNWNENYKKIKLFVEQTGKLPSQTSKEFKSNEKQLGQWRTDQIKFYKQKTLSKDKIQLLEDLPGWSWSYHSDMWKQKYENIKLFIQTNNKLPTEKDNYQLAKWQGHQLKAYKNQILSEDRIKLLKDINVISQTTLKITATDTQQITIRRGGQAQLRNHTLRTQQKCLLTNTAIPYLLDTAHIKPHSKCSEEEKYDLNNAILLRKDLHALFDKQAFTFDATGLVIYGHITQEERDYLDTHIINKQINMTPEMFKYIQNTKERPDNL